MGFETVVRPVVLPNIRPQPWRTQSVATTPAARTITDPPEGYAVIHGNPAHQINLTKSTSISITRSMMAEQQRRVDTVRIYQKQEDGTINKGNFVDVDSTNKMLLKDYNGTQRRHYGRIPTGDADVDNIIVRVRDKTYKVIDGYLTVIT